MNLERLISIYIYIYILISLIIDPIIDRYIYTKTKRWNKYS